MAGSYQYQVTVPLTKVVKVLIVANVSLWLGLVVILQNFFLSEPLVFEWLGFTPWSFFAQFYLWQPLTYMFIHSNSIFHVVFNMLMLWWLGSELEQRWGSRFFTTYYLVSGAGAAIIYLVGILLYTFLFAGGMAPLVQPVVGASGAIFGLILAYGLLFGDRIIYFMMIFPMKARYFVLILAGIEIVSMLNASGGQVANLAHLGGFISGYLFLVGRGRWQRWGKSRRAAGHGRRLKLVVDNERIPDPDQKGPRYWN